MGLTSSSPIAKLFGKNELKILMLGLDASGKTTILYKLKLGEVIPIAPTLGFSVSPPPDIIKFSFVSWNVGEGDSIKPLWSQCRYNTEGLIFVVDSSDRDRIATAKEELQRLLMEKEFKDSALLIFANKQDISGAMSVAEVAEKLDIITFKNRTWHIQGTCALAGDGLYEGLDWLSKAVSKKK